MPQLRQPDQEPTQARHRFVVYPADMVFAEPPPFKWYGMMDIPVHAGPDRYPAPPLPQRRARENWPRIKRRRYNRTRRALA